MVLFSEQCAFNSVNSGNMKQRNSLTSNNKQTGRRPAAGGYARYTQINISHLTCVKLTTGLENFERRTFLSLQLRSTKIVGDPTPVEKFVSQLGT